LFGPCVSKNGYWYCFSDNEDIIKSVEEMWMITHQRTQIPNIQLINKLEAMGLFMRNGKDVNWALFGEWKSRYQLHRIHALATSQGGPKFVLKLKKSHMMKKPWCQSLDCLCHEASWWFHNVHIIVEGLSK